MTNETLIEGQLMPLLPDLKEVILVHTVDDSPAGPGPGDDATRPGPRPGLRRRNPIWIGKPGTKNTAAPRKRPSAASNLATASWWPTPPASRPILDAMVANADQYENVEIVHMVAMGKAEYCKPEYDRNFHHNSFFLGATTRAAAAEGADFTPVFFSEIPSVLEEILHPNVAMIQVSPR